MRYINIVHILGVILHAFLSIADFFQNKPFRKIFKTTIRVRFVRPDLDPNCLQRLSAVDTGRQRVRLWKSYCSYTGGIFACFFVNC